MLSCTTRGIESACRFKTPVPGISVSSQGWPSVFRRGFMILFGAPPDPTTSGYSTSMYSSWSKGLPLRARDKGSRYVKSANRRRRQACGRAAAQLTSMCAFHASSVAVTVLVWALYRNSGSSRRPRHSRNRLRALSLLLIRWLLAG